MSYWIRHTVLVLLCVILPFMAALYMDTRSSLNEAKETSRRSLQLAVPGLQLILQNEAYRAVSSVMSTARRALDNDKYLDLRRGGSRADAAAEQILLLLNDATPRDGFAWLVDEKGKVMLANGRTGIEESPRSVRGHPVFVQTQLGYALDGVWSSHDELVQVAGAPLVDEGEVRGAVLVGRPVDGEAVAEWAETLRSHITLTSGDRVLVSSAPDELANEVVDAAYDAVSPVYSGDSERSLTDETIPFLPLLVDHRLAGEAFVSFGTPVLGAPNRYQWVISVDAAAGLSEIAQRQSAVLGAMVASFLVALLVGILNYRSYVVPIDRVAAHLSELQMGRGDLEMPEHSVSWPFRRLVRLINMTVQKLPNRGLTLASTDLSSITRPPGAGADLPYAPPAGVQTGSQPLAAPPMNVQTIESIEAADARDAGPPPEELASGTLGHFGNGGGTRPFEVSDQTEAALLPSGELERLGVPATPGAEAAIADAIAQLEGAPAGGVDLNAGAAAARRSAADIRGRPMGGGSQTPTPAFEDVSVSPTDTSPPSGGVRGGGSLDLGQGAALPPEAPKEGTFGPEETVVAPVATELLAQSAREDLTGQHRLSAVADDKPDATVVANVPSDLLARSAGGGAGEGAGDGERSPNAASAQVLAGLDPEDRAHFKEVYERFIDLRRRCGEPTSDLAFDRFLSKLARNRDNLVKKYNCRTVRFQVYKKDGKAALKATPVGGTR